MEKIKVKLGRKSYDITIGPGVFKLLPEVIKSMGHTGPVVFIADKYVWSSSKELISKTVKKIKNETVPVLVRGAEQSKSIDVYRDTVSTVVRKTKLSKPVFVALGGGVVGDLAGFIAATYRRGCSVIQVPTTLLAQVDSSVGGKVGIDLPEAKNLIGAFHQPVSVLMDVNFLKTLPKRQISNGLGEIIKYGIISDGSFFTFLEKNVADLFSFKMKTIASIVSRSAGIKADVVGKDEFDVKDLRIILNFGHTLGHAVETASGYTKAFNHGESVAVGMLMACEIAVGLGIFSERSLEKVKALVKLAGLPVRAKGVSRKGILDSYVHDKKFTKGVNRFVLPVNIGKVKVVDAVPEKLIREVIDNYAG